MVCMQVYAWAWSWWIHIRHAIARNNKLSNKQSSNPNRSFSVRLVEKVLICWCKNKNVLLQYPQDNKLTTITPSGWTSTRMASRSMLKKKTFQYQFHSLSSSYFAGLPSSCTCNSLPSSSVYKVKIVFSYFIALNLFQTLLPFLLLPLYPAGLPCSTVYREIFAL